jgi:phage baseplate assembly protein gpV
MNKKGIVSEIKEKENQARVTLQDMDNAVTDWLQISTILNLSVNDLVIICFCNDNLSDGVIVAKVG